MKDIFHVSSNLYKLWLLLCYLRVPFQLASPPGFDVVHIPKGNLVHIYKCVFWTFGFLFSSGRGSFLVLSAPWHAGSPPGPRTQVWALAEVRGTCCGGSKWHGRSGRDSEHVEPSRPLKTHVQVKRMSDGSCDIWDVEWHQYRQTILPWWWKSFSPTPTCQICDHFRYNKINLHDLARIS